MKEKLTGDDLSEMLDALGRSGWVAEDREREIRKSFKFRNFVDAFGWMTRAAMIAEKMNHHPDWSNAYNTVDVKLTTHSVGGLTDLDRKLAERMDRLV